MEYILVALLFDDGEFKYKPNYVEVETFGSFELCLQAKEIKILEPTRNEGGRFACATQEAVDYYKLEQWKDD